jgi:hypothetical protein
VTDLDGQIDNAEHGEQVLIRVRVHPDDRRAPAKPASE